MGEDREKNSYVYEFDELNRMEKIYRGDGKWAEYEYDGTSVRVGKTVGTAASTETETTKYYNMGATVLNEVSSEEGNTTNLIGAGIEARMSVTGSSITSAYFLQKNAHGDVTAAISGTERVATYDYDAFGNTLVEEGEINNPIRYSGEYLDEESGLIYLRARYYDPSVGRFISEDPIRDGMNWYAYCGNSPVMMVDPSGLVSIIFVAGDMYDQAEVRKEIYEDNYGTTCYIVPVYGGQDFAQKWNLWFSDYLLFDEIDAIEIISHGGAVGSPGKSRDGTAYATGFLYFSDDPNNDRLMARDTYHMNDTDASIGWLEPITKKVNEFNINGCNSANPDIYNIVFGFMQKVDSYNYTGWDGGAQWDWDIGDHVRGGGEYGTTFRHPIDPTYYVREYQATWWKYVEKNSNGSPKRNREGRRWFQRG